MKDRIKKVFTKTTEMPGKYGTKIDIDFGSKLRAFISREKIGDPIDALSDPYNDNKLIKSILEELGQLGHT